MNTQSNTHTKSQLKSTEELNDVYRMSNTPPTHVRTIIQQTLPVFRRLGSTTGARARTVLSTFTQKPTMIFKIYYVCNLST